MEIALKLIKRGIISNTETFSGLQCRQKAGANWFQVETRSHQSISIEAVVGCTEH